MKAVEAVADSIKEYGFNQPLVLDRNNVIISGHVRYKALKTLGVEKALCMVVDMDEKKAKEYRIIDNKTHEISEWDTDKLILELRDIDVTNLQSLFLEKEWAEMMNGLITYQSPTQEELTEAEQRLDTHYQRKYDKDLESFASITCPECGNVITVKKHELTNNG